MDTTMQILACVYTRISRDQTGERAGVERQLEDCTALAERLNLTVVEHFDDNDISAFSGKHRPGYEAMLTGMKRGEFNAIVCYHPDRLYRSLKDLERLIDTADATGVQIRSVNGGDFDLSNATGKMVARILGSVSRQESEHKAERQRRANQQRRTQGKWVAVGRVPFGYAKEGEPKHYTLVPSEPAASMVRQAAAEVLAGRSLRSLCIEWNGRGISTPRGNPWTNIALTRILTNPVYANMVVDYPQGRAGESRVIGSGTWEPLIDRETHEGLVAFLGDPARNPGSRFVRKHIGFGRLSVWSVRREAVYLGASRLPHVPMPCDAPVAARRLARSSTSSRWWCRSSVRPASAPGSSMRPASTSTSCGPGGPR